MSGAALLHGRHQPAVESSHRQHHNAEGVERRAETAERVQAAPEDGRQGEAGSQRGAQPGHGRVDAARELTPSDRVATGGDGGHPGSLHQPRQEAGRHEQVRVLDVVQRAEHDCRQAGQADADVVEPRDAEHGR